MTDPAPFLSTIAASSAAMSLLSAVSLWPVSLRFRANKKELNESLTMRMPA